MKEELSHQQSLDIIQAMVSQSRRRIADDGVYYLLWGYSVLAAALTHYLLLQNGFEKPWLAWLLMPVAGIISGIIGYRKGKSAVVKTHIDHAMGYVWAGFVVVLISVLVFSGKIGFAATYPVVLLLYGLGTFISGGLLRFKPLLWGGVCCWLCGLVAMYTAFDQQLLLMALAIVCGYIVPGHLLYSRRNA
jgi:hypothetical protein